jgi:hypothetical protein
VLDAVTASVTLQFSLLNFGGIHRAFLKECCVFIFAHPYEQLTGFLTVRMAAEQ